ncbi:MAG: hypothetical protein VB106_02805 [Clostridiaceae bacterium]|nr:hypothetical protein [Clostridiaceae bacterium]
MTLSVKRCVNHEMFISERASFEQEDDNFRHIGHSIEKADETLEELKLKGIVDMDMQVVVKQYSRQIYITSVLYHSTLRITQFIKHHMTIFSR